ncbi:hypothetical protein [Cryptosporangium sp. NPDC051539]|uniref:hypothetical protein n=1 Tax=Cryptosporangium sp. NPDC051539 TaxID=3363962 RepID=UPI0037B14612
MNLARLRIRARQTSTALDLLERIHHALATRTDIVVENRPLLASRLVATNDDHEQVRRWFGSVLIADGGRALASAGRWRDALAHQQRHGGIGARILDGRQIAVLGLATAGEHDQALHLLFTTQPGQPWETAVIMCLTTLIRADTHADTDVASILNTWWQAAESPGLAMFRTRLGLCALDVLSYLDHLSTDRMAADLVDQVCADTDGYAIRDLLSHPRCAAALRPAQEIHLRQAARDCGLGIPQQLAPHLDALTAAVLACQHLAERKGTPSPAANEPSRTA